MFDHTVQAVEPAKYTGYEIGRIFDYLIHTIRADGCQPIILTFLPKWAGLKQSWLTNVHLQIAERNRCYFFDFQKFASRLSAGGASIDSLYDDTNHPASGCQQEIARLLARAMISESRTSRANKRVIATRPSYDVLNVQPSPSASIVSRQTSIQSLEFCVITEESHVDVYSRGPCTLRGLVINSSECTAKLQINADPSLVKDLQIAREQERGLLRMQIAPVFSEVRDVAGVFQLSLSDQEALPTEKHITPPLAMGVSVRKQVEINSLIVEREPQVVDYNCDMPNSGGVDLVAHYS